MKLLFLLIVFGLTACGWNQKALEKVDPQKDLVESFSLSKKDFDKFKVVEAVPTPATTPKKETVKTSSQSKKKSLRNKKSSTSKKKEKIVKKKKQVKDNTSVKKTLRRSFAPPKDYPKDFLDYDKKSKKVWKLFKPKVFVNEKMVIDAQYFGVTVGKILLRTLPKKMINGQEVYHFHANLKSAPFYRYVYSLDDYVESFVTVDDFLPVKYQLVQNESKQQVNDLQVFDHDKRQTQFWYRRDKKGKIKEENKVGFIPGFIGDSFTPLLFVRGLPLKIGDHYEFPMVTRAKLWIVKIDVVSVEEIVVNGKDVSAIKLKAETHFPGVLKKRGDILFYYSNDERRKLLKFEAKIKLGTVEGELVDYSPGDS